MADDQVKYSDLIAQDVQPGLTMLAEALKAVAEQIASLKTEATALKGAMSAAGTATREQQQATAQQAASVEGLSKKVKQLTEEERRLEEVRKRYKKLTDEQIERVNAFQQALRGSTQQQMAAVNAIEVETKSYNELNAMYNALKDSLNAMTVAERQNTEAGKAMTVQSAKIYDTMNELQKATGKYTLQVGKYRAAFDGLGYSFQQILREAPSALNLNQFFLAISNNVPMFVDQLKAFNEEQKAIKANLAQMTKGTAEYAEQLGKVESVGKKLGRTLMSWQTLVLVGLMILRNWEKIVAGISSLFNRMTQEQKMLKAVNEEAASSVGELTAKYVALQKEWKNLNEEEKPEWVEQHKNDWIELGESIDDAKKAEDFYVNNTAAVQEAINARARSIAAMKLATEKYEEAFKKQVEAERGKANRNTSFGSALARGLAGAGMAEGNGVLSPEQMASQTRAEEEAIESLYQKRMTEVRKIEDEARQMINTFVLPEQSKTKTGKEKKEKEPKDEVADLLTLQRQLEDQIIANIEDEYEKLELAEIKRHERFIEDQEAELKKLADGDPRRAVILKMIEEEQETHDRNMLDIDEKYRQDLIKQREKEAAEAEKAAKEEAKATYKALADGWQEERAKLVERGAKKKQLIKAEIDAEINRLSTMLNIQRSLNGEIMTDEEKAKIQEWIILLNKFKDAGDFSNIKSGQIYGSGGSKIDTNKKNYTSATQMVADVLGIDISQEQISALNSVFDQAKAALNSWMDARKAAADQAKELADDEVSSAEQALNREIELRNQGYANDVALREKELADAKAQQKKALEMQQKAKTEELAINTALEASNMAVAVANLFKQFPVYVAIPLAAVMLGAWGAAKYSAISQVKSTKYRDGGVMLLEGGSHESGHDVNLGIGPDGSNLRAEGGEYFAVINKRSSRKYGSQIPAVVNALNSGMFEDRYIKTSDAVGMMGNVGLMGNVGEAVDLSAVESGVGELVKQGEQKWSIEGDWKVMRYKNLTRRVKIG